MLWIVVTLVVAASLEIITGRQLPGLTALISLIVVVPVPLKIWRRRAA